MRLIYLPFLIPFFALIFSGCAASHGMHQTSQMVNMGGSRVVIYNATVDLEVEKPHQTVERIIPLGKKYGGYMVSSSNSQVVLRVKVELFETALKEITGLGDVSEREIRGQDVTEQYKDLEIRLDNAIKARERYVELLKKAENVSTALEVQKALNDITTKIEQMKGQLKRMKHLVAFATITVNIEEEITPGPIGWIFYGGYHAIKWLFVW